MHRFRFRAVAGWNGNLKLGNREGVITSHRSLQTPGGRRSVVNAIHTPAPTTSSRVVLRRATRSARSQLSSLNRYIENTYTTQNKSKGVPVKRIPLPLAYPQLNPPCKPLTATLSRRHLVCQCHGLWLASGRVLEGELEDLAARGRLRVVVRELSAPLLHIEADKGRVVLEPSGDQLLEVAGASMPHLRRGVDLKEANELLI